jgi:hypothetical protein
MRDYQYTIHREGRQIIQRQVIDHVGVIILCENRAAKVLDIAAMTEHGNYCYHWDSTAEGVTLLKATDDYLMDKLLAGHDERRVLDLEAAFSALCSRMTPDDKRDSDCARGYALATLNACQTLDDMIEWAKEYGDGWGITEETVKSAAVYRYGDDARAFMRHVLPAIRRSALELEKARNL